MKPPTCCTARSSSARAESKSFATIVKRAFRAISGPLLTNPCGEPATPSWASSLSDGGFPATKAVPEATAATRDSSAASSWGLLSRFSCVSISPARTTSARPAAAARKRRGVIPRPNNDGVETGAFSATTGGRRLTGTASTSQACSRSDTSRRSASACRHWWQPTMWRRTSSALSRSSAPSTYAITCSSSPEWSAGFIVSAPVSLGQPPAALAEPSGLEKAANARCSAAAA